jgi:hypothetical protein
MTYVGCYDIEFLYMKKFIKKNQYLRTNDRLENELMYLH